MLPSSAASSASVAQSRHDALTNREQAYVLRMGERGYQRFEALRKKSVREVSSSSGVWLFRCAVLLVQHCEPAALCM